MFTQQAQLLATQFGPNSAGVMQTLGNCAQPLATRGPVQFDAAARSRPPRGGVIPSLSNAGGLGIQPPTGSTLNDYYNGHQPTAWNQYPGTDWTPQFFSGMGSNAFYAGDGNYWGGDTFYGPNYLSSNDSTNAQQFNNQILNNYNAYDSYYNNVSNNLVNQNLSNWYSQQFIDQSYNDFSLNIDSTSNLYQQTVNSFAGDNYFDNTVTANTTVNNNVVNEGDVYNNSGVYIDESKTFITNNKNNIVNLRQFVENVFNEILVDARVTNNIFNLPRPPGVPPLPPPGKLPRVRYSRVVGVTFDPEECTVNVQYENADADVQ